MIAAKQQSSVHRMQNFSWWIPIETSFTFLAVAFVEFLCPDDVVIANDAATLPASLSGVHQQTGKPIEVRLAGRPSLDPMDVKRFSAVVFGEGDFHMRTEDRPLPPVLKVGDTLLLGPLRATVEGLLDHPRLVSLLFSGTRGRNLGRARTTRPSDSVFARADFARALGRMDQSGRGRLLPSNHLRQASYSTGRFCRRFANITPPSRRSLTQQASPQPAMKISIDCYRSTSLIAFPRRRRRP